MQTNATARTALAALAAAAIIPGAARATDLTVDCNSQSLQAAIDSLAFVGPHNVFFTGTCSEAVLIIDRDRITLGSDGTGQILADAGSALRIAGSSRISLGNFTVTSAGGSGLVVTRGSEVRASGLTAQNNALQGFQVTLGSILQIDTSRAQFNGASGFRIDSATAQFTGGVVSANNTGNGLAGSAAHINIAGDVGLENSFSDNAGSGLACSDTCRVNLNGANFFNGNGGGGVFVFHGSAVNAFGVTITGNGDSGFVAGETSHAETANTTITNNGSATGGAGVRLYDHGEGYLDGGDVVTGNAGGGVLGTAASLISSIGGNTITGNGGPGVSVDHLSIAHFFAADTLSGNTGSNLSCDGTSIVYGDPGNVTNVDCKNVEKGKSGPHFAPIRRPDTSR